MEAGAPPPAPPPASPTPAAKRINAGDVVNETFSIYGDNIGTLIGGGLIIFVIVGLVAGLLQHSGGFFLILLASIVHLVGLALYTGFVVKLVEGARGGRTNQSIGDLFSAATPFIGALIGFGILFGIGVGIGLFLIIVPGLILLTIWSVGGPAIVIEQVGAIDAFGRSRELVRGDGWQVFWTLVVVFVIVVLVGIVLGIIATPISEVATVIASIIADVITAPVFAIACSVMFFRLGGGGGQAAAPPAA
jgi:hypothetical protein